MAMSILNNSGAQLTLGELNKNITKVGAALSKISTGQKITGAKDDAAGYSISEKMREQIRSLLQDNQNVQNGSSMIKVAAGGIQNIVDNLRELKKLAVDAANDSNTNEDRATINKEFQARLETVNDIATETKYNGKRLLDGTYKHTKNYSRIVLTPKEETETVREIVGYETKTGTAHAPGVTKVKNTDGTTTLFQRNNTDTIKLADKFSPVDDSIKKFDDGISGGGIATDSYYDAYGSSWNWAKAYQTANFTPTADPSGTSTVTPQNVIKNIISSLDTTTLKGTAALDKAISTCGNGIFSDWSDLTSSFIRDLQSSSSVDDFLQTYCDIDLSNIDTGAITGYDAGGSSTEIDGHSIVPESSTPSSWTLPTDSETVYGSLTVKWPDSSTGGAGGGNLSSAEEHIIKGLYSEWIPRSLELVKSSLGINFDDPNPSTVSEITVKFVNENTNTLAYVSNSHYNSGPQEGDTVALDLVVNMNYYNDVITSSEDGETTHAQAGYLDRTLAHEFTHAVMGADIKYFSDLPLYVIEGTAELVHGIDDERTYNIRNYVNEGINGGSASTLQGIFSSGGTSGTEEPYVGGYLLLRYLAKQESQPIGYEESFSKTPTSMTQNGVNIAFDLTNVSSLSDLDGQGFSILCGECSQYINIKFDSSLGMADSTFERADTDELRSEYIIGIADATLTSNGLAEAIFKGIADSENEYDFADIYVDDGDGDETNDELVSVQIDARHDVRIAKNPYYDSSDPDSAEYLFIKENSPSMHFLDEYTIIGVEAEDSTDNLPAEDEDGNIDLTEAFEVEWLEPIYKYVEYTLYDEVNETYADTGVPLHIHHGTRQNQRTAIFINDMHTKSLGTDELYQLDEDGNLIFLHKKDEDRYYALSYDEDKQAEWIETLMEASEKTLDDISVSTRRNANVAIRVLDGAIDYALDEATTMGAYLQRFEFTDQNITTTGENTQASESTIRDADMAKEMMNYTKANVLSQASQSMLAQANQNSSAVLSLLQ